MSTHNTAPDRPFDEAHSNPTTPASSDHGDTVPAHIDDQTPRHAASSNGLKDLEKLRAQAEAQVNSLKNDIKSALDGGGAMEVKEKADLQQLQNQITQLEDFLEIGKKVDLQRQSPPAVEGQDEQSLQPTNAIGGREFYEDLCCMAEAISARFKTRKASLPDDGTAGETEPRPDSRDTADTESGDNGSYGNEAPTYRDNDSVA
jgi:TolA-binding protein